MQVLAAYMFKAELDSSVSSERAQSIEDEVDKWLEGKGSDDPQTSSGTFTSLSGDGEGSFTRSLVKSKRGNINGTTLIETAHSGQTFTTNIQVIQEHSTLTIFSTLVASDTSNIIAPQSIYPRCPQIIRKLIESNNDWTFGDKPIPSGNFVTAFGERKSLALCDNLIDTDRIFPYVVISNDPDGHLWDSLPHEAARDLAGLAHVAIIDEEGSWAMTDELGKSDSCYLGAVRLYWPIASGSQATLRSRVWTSQKLHQFGTDTTGMRRFLSVLRRTVMSAAALTIAPPACMRAIMSGAIADKISEARQSAVEEELRPAVDKELQWLVDENASLSEQLAEANLEIAKLRGKIYNLERRQDSRKNDDGDNDDDPDQTAPEKDQVTYYKKIGKKGAADDLVKTGPCNHTAWKPAHRADQAVKGIQKLEGSGDWQSLQHCGSCTGGGRWRVQW